MLKSFRYCLFLTIMSVAVISLAGCASTPPPAVSAAHHSKSSRPAATSNNDIAKTTAKTSSSGVETAYKANSDDADAALAYAESLHQSGRLQRAAIVLNPFIQDENTDNVPLIAEYAGIQAAMRNYTEAETYAHKALAIDPKNGPAYHVLGIALDAQDKHDQAETAFRNALDNWEGDPSPVLNNLGLNLAAQDFLDAAVATLQKAATLNPDSAEIKRNLRIVVAMQKQSPHPAGPPRRTSRR